MKPLNTHTIHVLHGNINDIQLSNSGYKTLTKSIINAHPNLLSLTYSPHYKLQGKGVKEFNSTSSTPEEDFKSLLQDLISRIKSSKSKFIIIISHIDSFLPDKPQTPEHFEIQELLQSLSLQHANSNRKDVIIFLAENLSELSSFFKRKDLFFTSHDLPLPSSKDISLYLKSLGLSKNLTYLSNIATGMSLSEIKTLSLNKTLTEADFLKAKAESIANYSDGLITFVPSNHGLEGLAGLKAVRTRFQEVSTLIKTNPNLAPSGLLLMGAPGTGKTAFVKALAFDTNLPCLTLQSIRSKWVGESESRFQKALDLIKRLSPCIVFLDELDQSFGSRSAGGDGGVDARLFGMLLEVIADPTQRGKILWIGATNRPDLIDAALKRSGRLEDHIPFLLPEPHEYPAYIVAIADREGLSLSRSSALPEEIVSLTLTGSDLTTILLNASEHALLDSRLVIDSFDLRYAVLDFIPSPDHNLSRMQDAAIAETSHRRYLTEPVNTDFNLLEESQYVS